MSNITRLIKGHEVYFREEDHKYFVDGIEKPSVTQILKAVSITSDPNGRVNANYLRACAEHGTLVHKEIEDFLVSGGKVKGITDEFEYFRKHIYKKFKNWQSEVTVMTEDYCGRCDAICQDKLGNYIVMDYKTGKIDKNSCSWQLSLYAYALREMGIIPKLAVIRLIVFDAKNVGSQLVPCEEIKTAYIEKMLEDYRENKEYQEPSLPMESTLEQKALQIEKAIAETEKSLSLLKEQQEAYKKEMKKHMSENGINAMEGKTLSVKYSQYQQVRFNEALLKEKAPKTWEKYHNKVVDCEKLTITVKEEENNAV